ncbi:DeoR family transcriptional regulator [Lysinibacillus sp. MHQ-1]|nr:DeoR family transcriptional regulator [Lysinibacillus sp. MHQ-1]
MIERQQQILQFVRQHKVVKLVTLTKEFNVSMETIRRDIQQLVQDKKIEKFYGGIKYIEPVEGLIDQRLHEQLTEKNCHRQSKCFSCSRWRMYFYR